MRCSSRCKLDLPLLLMQQKMRTLGTPFSPASLHPEYCRWSRDNGPYLDRFSSFYCCCCFICSKIASVGSQVLGDFLDSPSKHLITPSLLFFPTSKALPLPSMASSSFLSSQGEQLTDCVSNWLSEDNLIVTKCAGLNLM